MGLDEQAYLGANISILCRDANCIVYQVNDESGEGVMTHYEIFPGIVLLFNDFHLRQCYSQFRPGADILCIDHCREGRIEWELDHSTCVYVEAGDININTREQHERNFHFPLQHYHGLTIGIVLEEAVASLSNVLNGFPVDLYAVREQFCHGSRPFIARAFNTIDYSFADLYAVLPNHLRQHYYQVKILELLLRLSTLQVQRTDVVSQYFYKTQIEKVKAIMAFITANPQIHYTLNELSTHFQMPLTSMNQCFKGVYGTSIYAYMREFRMNAAALELRQTDDKVADIAARLGYDNASKFAAAFKSVVGLTPVEYRKSIG